mgnify:CR=1 FL=1
MYYITIRIILTLVTIMFAYGVYKQIQQKKALLIHSFWGLVIFGNLYRFAKKDEEPVMYWAVITLQIVLASLLLVGANIDIFILLLSKVIALFY